MRHHILQLFQELNPFLGYRAIRLCLDKKSIFLTQLKAILRAGLYGDVKILIPMISSMEELLQIKDLIKKAKDELADSNISVNEDIEIGIIIEELKEFINNNIKVGEQNETG